ncbi:MAG: glycosyltransferase family 4 protein [Cyanobacteriota bacterium SKYGB_h_bin112]|nr:glycosyltransferase family 4 protein [Cyanobacteriota bacterium SKYGB_h_bin112]
MPISLNADFNLEISVYIAVSSKLPRILMLHNRYQFPGGEDASMEAEVELLRQAGHDVVVMEQHNNTIEGMSRWQKIVLAATTVWNSNNYQQLCSYLEDAPADVLHVQNFFPLWSPSVHAAAKVKGLSTVQHLRNFRLACLNAYLLRSGQVCEACLGKNPWRGLVYRCYRNSLPASLTVWSLLTVHRWRQTWLRDVDAFITPSQFAATKLLQAGIPGDRLHVKPDFIADPLANQQIPPLPDTPTFVFIGRLNEQKGVAILLEAWRQLNQPEWRLDLIGEGDRRAEFQQYVQHYQLSNVRFHGQRSTLEIMQHLQTASMVVVPSQSYETFGRVVIEAFACGRTALVASLGALPELVQDGVTGLHSPPNDPHAWAERLRWAGEHASELAAMGIAARQVYLTGYTPAVNYRQLLKIYQQVL